MQTDRLHDLLPADEPGRQLRAMIPRKFGEPTAVVTLLLDGVLSSPTLLVMSSSQRISEHDAFDVVRTVPAGIKPAPGCPCWCR